jgi:hypothetical protein
MNTYDPAHYIVYVSMDRTFTATGSLAPSIPPAAHRLPGGYANQSPRTRLRRAAAAEPVNPAILLSLSGPA